MIDFSFTYQRDGFNLAHTKNASLYIRAGKNGISFLIEQNGEAVAWKDFAATAELTGESNLLQVLTLPYKETKLALMPDAFTLIPAEIFDAKDATLYARYLDVKSDDKVLAAAFDDKNYLVGKLGGQLIETLAQHFDLTQAVPADKGWINIISKNDPSSNQLYVNITEAQVSIANFKDLSLHFYNSFEAQNTDDLLYYMLFAADQIQLKGNEVTIVASGYIAEGDETWNKLATFFSSVKLADQQILQLPEAIKSQQVLALAAL